MVLNIVSWNCAGGIKGKIDAIRKLSTETKPDFLFISESEFDGSNAEYLRIEGYHLDVAATVNLGKARLVCYVANNIKEQIPRQLNLEGSNKDIITYGNSNVRIAGVYRGFKCVSGTTNENLEEFFSAMNEICSHHGKTLIQGDFNIDPSRDIATKQGKLLADCCLENSLINLMKNTTRRRVVNRVRGLRLEESCIDLALTNDVTTDCLNFSNVHSDHDFIWSKMSFDKISHKTEKVSIRDYTRLTSYNVAHRIKEDIKNLPELEAFQKSLLDELAPFRVIRTRTPTDIINPRVEKLKKKRDRMFKKYKKSGNEKRGQKTDTSSEKTDQT